MHYEDSYNESPLWNRIAIVALALMAAAYLFAVISPAVSSAGADDQVALRDDGSGDLVASQDDDDDDDDDTEQGSDGTGQRSIGSESGNTATGTTRGTGVSQSVSDSGDRSANTATGTTRGTGPSQSVSNSS